MGNSSSSRKRSAPSTSLRRIATSPARLGRQHLSTEQPNKTSADTLIVPAPALSHEIIHPLTPVPEKRGTLESTSDAKPEENEETEENEKSEERCYDPNDPTFTFVNGDDDMDFECNDYKSLRAMMSCGHTVTPTSLMNWCQWLLKEGGTIFVCGVCLAEWPYEEVYRMALMTPEEINDFDGALSKTVVTDLLGAKKCPGCKSLVIRSDLNDLRVLCTVCTDHKGRDYEFCWQCLKKWKRPSPYSDRCARDDCISPLEVLRTCGVINLEDVSDVTTCPSVRACPTCGLLIEHSGKACKNIFCDRCKVEFCFVCLRLTEECLRLKPESYFSLCFGGVAPRQTTIPVRGCLSFFV